MDQDKKLEIIDTLRDFFLKCFWISFVLLLITSVISLLTFGYEQQILANFYDLESEDFSKVYVEIFSFWKIIVFQFSLIPAVALWFMENKIKRSIGK